MLTVFSRDLWKQNCCQGSCSLLVLELLHCSQQAEDQYSLSFHVTIFSIAHCFHVLQETCCFLTPQYFTLETNLHIRSPEWNLSCKLFRVFKPVCCTWNMVTLSGSEYSALAPNSALGLGFWQIVVFILCVKLLWGFFLPFHETNSTSFLCCSTLCWGKELVQGITFLHRPSFWSVFPLFSHLLFWYF